jgi:predicted ATPase
VQTPTDDMAAQGVRIVLTGGPGGGKTTAADLFRRELEDQVVVVPEAATLLFSGGFPRHSDGDARCAAQKAIFYVQRALEDTQRAEYPGRILLCDRGTLDGAAYWPEDRGDFFEHMGTTQEEQLARYDAVIFFETAAAGGLKIEGNNPVRTESEQEALALDRKLTDVWSQHPRFIYVNHNPSFFKKITFGLAALESVVAQLRHKNGLRSVNPAG